MRHCFSDVLVSHVELKLHVQRSIVMDIMVQKVKRMGKLLRIRYMGHGPAVNSITLSLD